MMPDEFILLTDCDDRLPVAKVVDRIPFYRFVSLNTPSDDDGKTQKAIYPTDHATPELVKEYAIDGWPPEDILSKRGGVSLLPEWVEPPEESRVAPAIRITVNNLDDFLANPGATVDVQLDSTHVEALLSTGQTHIRREQGPPVLVQVGPSAITQYIVSNGKTIETDIATLLESGQQLLPISVTNIRELREHGSTWVQLSRTQGGRQVRVLAANHAVAASNGSLSVHHEGMLGFGKSGVHRSIAYSASSISKTDTISLQELMNLPSFKVPERDTTDIGVITQHPKHRPSFKLPSFEFVLYLAYRQEWELLGYARGDLLNTISLAPQEEITIEVFTWDRFKSAEDTTEESGWESSLEAGFTGKTSRDITAESTRNEAWKLTSAGVNITGPKDIGVDVDVGGDFGTSLTTVNKDTVSLVNESTAKAATKARGMRQTKVSETHEWGSEERSTRKLRNENMGRSVSYDLFEVLASYQVKTQAVPEQTRLAILGPSPLPVKAFDRPTVSAFEGPLRRALLDENQKSGFDAIRWLAARDEYKALQKVKEVASAPPAQQTLPSQQGAPGQTSQQTTVPTDPILAAGDRVSECIRTILDADKRAVKKAWDAGKRGDELKPAEIVFRQWMLRKFGFDEFQPRFWQACTRFENEWKNDRSVERCDQLLKETASAWLETVGNVTFTIALGVLLWPYFLVRFGDLVLTLTGELGAGEAATHVWNGHVGFDDAGLGAKLDGARTVMTSYRKALEVNAQPVQTQNADPNQPAQANQSAETNPVAQPDPGQSGQPQEPFPDGQAAAHMVAQSSLLVHLENNRSHYLEAIWASFQPTDRARLLAVVFGKLGDEVEPELLGFHEDKVAVPFRTDRYPGLKEHLEEAIAAAQGAGSEDARDVVLPTAGLHLQTRLGECDALEPFLTGHREQDLAAKKLQVRHDELENERLEARLNAQPAQLEDPNNDGRGLTVRLVDHGESQPDE